MLVASFMTQVIYLGLVEALCPILPLITKLPEVCKPFLQSIWNSEEFLTNSELTEEGIR